MKFRRLFVSIVVSAVYWGAAFLLFSLFRAAGLTPEGAVYATAVIVTAITISWGIE